MDRKIEEKKVRNIRDLGGITNKDGFTIKEKHLIRSSKLNKISEDFYERNNIKTVIDLRIDLEIDEAPDKYTDKINYVKIPIISGSRLGITHEKDSRKSTKNIPDLRDLYSDIFKDEYSIEKIKETLKLIMNNRDGAILWHCTEGKDRCGIISALILYILGVDMNIIYDDYMLTNEAAKRRARKFYILVFLVRFNRKIARRAKDIFLAYERYLDASIDTIKAEYGSLDEFIKNKLEISDEEINNFKDYVLKK